LNDKRKINSSATWLWYISAVSYCWIIYVYYFTDAAQTSKSDYMKSWIPLDIMLMFFVSVYYFFSKYMQKHFECDLDQVEVEDESVNVNPSDTPGTPSDATK